MLKRMLWLPIMVTAVSCSQGPGSGSSNSVIPDIEAQFIDDPVKGLEFVTASGVSSKTQGQGKFKCKKGEKVEFKLAGKHLGWALCGDKIFVDDLSSDEADYSPEKVAALIQSFAVAGGGELDLSLAVSKMPANALSAISFAGNDTTFANNLSLKVDEIKVSVPSLNTVITAKDPADMRSILDAAIAVYSNLSVAFKDALGLKAHANLEYNEIPANKFLKLTGKLTSLDPNDECYDYVQAQVSVTQVAAGKPFKFVVHRTASFDALDAYDPTTNLCKNSNWCDEGTEMPTPRLISSSSINFFSTMSMSDASGSWSSQTVAQLNGSVKNGGLLFTGSFQENGEYSDTGGESGTFSCKYAVTSENVAIPAEGPMTESGDADYTHVDLPAGATGTYSLSNPGSVYCSDGTQALLAGGVLPTSFDVAISGQSVVVSNTSSVDESWTKNGSWFHQYGENPEDGQHAVYFNDSGKWHLDLTYNLSSPDQVGIYVYHIPSGGFDGQYCSFQIDRNPE